MPFVSRTASKSSRSSPAARRAVLTYAIAICALALVATGCWSTNAAPGTTTTAGHPASNTSGWVVHVYGSAAISVPPNWVVENNSTCLTMGRSGTLLLGPTPPGPICSEAIANQTSVNIVPLSPNALRYAPCIRARIKSNGMTVYIEPCSTSDASGEIIWLIPALNVEVCAIDGSAAFNGTSTDTVVGRVLHSIRRATPSEIATRSPLNQHLTLSRTRVKAGTPIDGVVILINTTATPIFVNTCAAAGWLDVGLDGIDVAFAPAHIAIGCSPSVLLPPGATRIPVTISTSFQGCAEVSATWPLPKCVPQGIPPLPPGTYHTKVTTVGLPTDTSPANVITVTLVR